MTSVGNLTLYGSLKLLASATGGPAFSLSDLWLGLYTIPPTNTSVGVEVSAGSYYRQSISFLAPYSVGGAAQTSNSVLCSFPVSGGATAVWGEIQSFAILDGVADSANQIWWGDLETDVTINIGDSIQFGINTIILSMD